ncbi:MAG: sigma-54-dependent Fis family transcriptional regulator [Candidatus Latescibacterota bacterium]|nr:MAG: sigma-54-dependent Fis family transcriptional regulator [Candidatus Latescibacterota bacterium]
MSSKDTRENDRSGRKAARAADFFDEARGDLEEIGRSGAVKSGENLARTLAQMEHKVSKLETLSDATKALSSTLDLDEVLEKIVDSTIHLADTDRGFLMLAAESGALEFRIARDREKRSLAEDDFTVSRSIVNDVARSAEPLFISNILDYERFKDQKSVIDLNLQRAVCVPLTIGDSVIGVIYTDANRVSSVFAPEDMSVIGAFASQAAIAIENAKLHGKLVVSRESLAQENLQLREELSGRYQFSGIIGHSKTMQEIFITIQKVAPLTTTVLIQGETGTGKELIARAIHFNGPRKNGQLVAINCGAMPPNLLESELFGHKKGAFTGATSDKAGLFEAASGGTIFLDEVGEMPAELQVKLLRALQEGEIRRVGENADRKVNVRVIAATNRDLKEDVAKGLFRSDLYYRLNVVPITIPPLRDRRDDIMPLAEHFLKKYAAKMGKSGVSISSDAMKLLLLSAWPGNVRELENTIERGLALCGDSKVLKAPHFPQIGEGVSALGNVESGLSLKERLKTLERQIIIETLGRTGWRVSKAAELLDVSRQHLHNKIREYNITLP